MSLEFCKDAYNERMLVHSEISKLGLVLTAIGNLMLITVSDVAA